MKFETEFNIRDEVFVIHNNVVQRAIITKIRFPEPSLVCKSYDNRSIICFVWPQCLGSLPESKSWACEQSVQKAVYEIGHDIDDLLKKTKENAKNNGLTRENYEKGRGIRLFKSRNA